jgi:hypothetical protein
MFYVTYRLIFKIIFYFYQRIIYSMLSVVSSVIVAKSLTRRDYSLGQVFVLNQTTNHFIKRGRPLAGD